jgi:hypothetical protein
LFGRFFASCHGTCFEAITQTLKLWQTIQTKEVVPTAEGLASNHTNKHIKNVKERKKKVVLQGVHHPVEALPAKDLPEEKAREEANKGV